MFVTYLMQLADNQLLDLLFSKKLHMGGVKIRLAYMLNLLYAIHDELVELGGQYYDLFRKQVQF